jgi:23S rRNA (cytidine1920-2'-O)/16S rRNA (cytidine1409-2'-O)-methyltransferase
MIEYLVEMEEERLDKILMQRGLVSTRTRGEELIRSGEVLVNGKTLDKPGKKISVDAKIELLSQELEWVSRGALKLVAALDQWEISPEGRTWMDIGASTGGFTQVLLSKGAAHVTCIDVGTKQLSEKLLGDPRITNFEKTHVRELTHKHFPEPVSGAVIDVSFISLEKVIPFLTPFLAPGADMIALVKPQFEVGKQNIDKHGIVKSPALYPEVLERIRKFAEVSGYDFKAQIESPIKGGDGNREFLFHLVKRS